LPAHLVVAHQAAASPELIQPARNLEAQDPERLRRALGDVAQGLGEADEGRRSSRARCP
jgi:hypothetical protein